MTEQEAIKFLTGYLDSVVYKEKCVEAHKLAIKALEEIQQYRAIGTVEECREAVEKQMAKKPKINKVDVDTIYMKCLTCGLTTVLYNKMQPEHCPNCGQKLDWSEEE